MVFVWVERGWGLGIVRLTGWLLVHVSRDVAAADWERIVV